MSQLVLTEIPIGVSLTYILRINTSPAMVSKQRTFRFINESIDKEKHLSSVDECPDKEIVSAEMKEKIKIKMEQDKKKASGKRSADVVTEAKLIPHDNTKIVVCRNVLLCCPYTLFNICIHTHKRSI